MCASFVKPVAEKNFKNLILEKIAARPSGNITKIDESYSKSGTAHSPTFTCRLTLVSNDSSFPSYLTVEAKGGSKSLAMHSAYRDLHIRLASRVSIDTERESGFVSFDQNSQDKTCDRITLELISGIIHSEMMDHSPMARSLICQLLQVGGVECNPGPRVQVLRNVTKKLRYEPYKTKIISGPIKWQPSTPEDQVYYDLVEAAKRVPLIVQRMGEDWDYDSGPIGQVIQDFVHWTTNIIYNTRDLNDNFTVGSVDYARFLRDTIDRFDEDWVLDYVSPDTISKLLMISGVEPNPGPVYKAEESPLLALLEYFADNKLAKPIISMSEEGGTFKCILSYKDTNAIDNTFVGISNTKAEARDKAARQACLFEKLIEPPREVEASSISITLGADSNPITFMEYQSATTTGRLPWVCCKCEASNYPDVTDDYAYVCDRCSTNVKGHMAVAIVAAVFNDVSGPLMLWAPQFGRTAKHSKTEAKKEKKVERKVEKKVEAKVEKHVKRQARQVANKEIKKQIIRPQVPQDISRKYVEMEKSVVSQVLRDILKAIVLPMQAGEVRMPIDWNAVKTTCFNPWGRMAVPFNAGANPGAPNTSGNGGFYTLPGTEYMCFLIKGDACSTLIFYDFNTAASAFSYTLKGITGTNLKDSPPSSSWVITGTDSGSALPAPTKLHLVYGVGTTSWTPHGTMYYARKVGSQSGRYLWFEHGHSITISVTLASGTGTVALAMDRWDPDSDVTDNENLDTIGSAAGTYSITVFANSQGYYCPKLVPVGTCSYLTITINSITLNNDQTNGAFGKPGLGGVWCHRSMPNLDQNIASFPSLRTIGASLMFSNTDPKLYIGGKIAQAQAPPGSFWTQFVYQEGARGSYPNVNQSYGFGAVSSLQQSDQRPADKGSYGYIKPTSTSEFEWHKDWILDGNILMDSCPDLTKQRPFLVWTFSGPATAQDGYFTYSFTNEAITTDTSRPVDKARGDPAVVYELQKELMRLPQFGENPSHLKKLCKAIGGSARWLAEKTVEYGPKALQMAQAFIN